MIYPISNWKPTIENNDKSTKLNTMNKDKRKLEPMLRAFKNGSIDIEYAVDFILHIYSDSKRFNSNSFLIGMLIGSVLGLICLKISISI